MNNNAFKIDFRKWVLLLLPTSLRHEVLYHFIYVMLTPLVGIYRTFAQRRMTNNLYAKYDSSNGNIQRMLNILFHSDEGTIIVRPVETTDVEVKKVYITNDWQTPNSAFVGESYIDKAIPQKLFEVVIPSDLQDKEYQITNVVSRYTLPGYGFNVIIE